MPKPRTEIRRREPSSQPVFWGGLRTAFGLAHRGTLKDARPDDLLACLIREHKKRFRDAHEQGSQGITDLVAGCAYPEGEQGYNIARVAALGAGLDLPGMTVNRLCGSALEAAAIAAAGVASGRADAWLVGGVESMSRVPRRGANFSESDLIKANSPQAYVTMGETAENVARQFPRISRAAQEEFACASHAAAHAAWQSGFYDGHVIRNLGDGQGDGLMTFTGFDDSIRHPANPEKMASLAPAFRPDGVVTAATSSPMSDGAAAGLVTSEDFAKSRGARDYLRVIDIVTSHVAPELMGIGPVPAVKKLLERNSLKAADLAAVEMNEAFAIQVLACVDALELDPGIVNSRGGALAIGHPLGASGLRLLMTLHARMAAGCAPGDLGIATLCVGGGQGIAMLCEYTEAT